MRQAVLFREEASLFDQPATLFLEKLASPVERAVALPSARAVHSDGDRSSAAVLARSPLGFTVETL
jgi:hypothetical protein